LGFGIISLFPLVVFKNAFGSVLSVKTMTPMNIARDVPHPSSKFENQVVEHNI
jgi:hypothetical protein